MLHKGKSSDASDSYCQLDFQNYSKKTGKAVVVKRAVYNETKKGDIFYLVYVDNELFGFYPNNKFELQFLGGVFMAININVANAQAGQLSSCASQLNKKTGVV